MKEATWVVIGCTLIFIGARLGVVILPEMAKGYVKLDAATAPSPGASPSPAASPATATESPVGQEDLIEAKPPADGGVVNMGGGAAW